MSPRKTQLMLGFFATVALLSVLTFFETFKGTKFKFSLPSLNQSAFLGDEEADSDKDGLSDTSESYWNTDFQDPDTDKDGFKDGEEVVSGHDPTIPSPDDKINLKDQPQNITKKIGGLVLSGLSEGSLRQDSPKFNDSVNQVVDDALLQYSVNAGEIPRAVVTNVVPDTEENTKQYGTAMFNLFHTMPEDVMRGYERMVDAAKTINKLGPLQYDTFFINERERLNNHIRTLESIPVPQKWTTQHRRMIDMLIAIQRNYQLIRESDNSADPIQGVIAISALADVMFRDLPLSVGLFRPIFPSQ